MAVSELVFASHNRHKTKEINELLSGVYRVLSLDECGITDEIEETGATLDENALLKARYVFDRIHKNCFADDTGLEVESLNGRPGVYSARYAGPQKNSSDNIGLLLKELEGHANRKARFRTVVALILNGKEYLFEGVVEGSIALACAGEEGFGYDPVFIPDGSNRTFAQMSSAEKNAISHRARAVELLVGFLRQTGEH
jgi:XTP/dITP diphosphohydrolase